MSQPSNWICCEDAGRTNFKHILCKGGLMMIYHGTKMKRNHLKQIQRRRWLNQSKGFFHQQLFQDKLFYEIPGLVKTFRRSSEVSFPPFFMPSLFLSSFSFEMYIVCSRLRKSNSQKYVIICLWLINLPPNVPPPRNKGLIRPLLGERTSHGYFLFRKGAM